MTIIIQGKPGMRFLFILSNIDKVGSKDIH